MTASVSQPTDFWSSFLPTPQPRQDSDLLGQVGFIPGLREVLMVRQVHALEHATVWILSGQTGQPSRDLPRQVPQSDRADNDTLGGLSTEQGFYLYGQVQTGSVRRAVQTALNRITHGEWDLAVHPRCGTNLSVEMMLTASLALGIHLVLPRGPIEQLLGIGVAATTAAQLAPELGRLVQQYVTTSIPFNLSVQDVTVVQDTWGRPAHFVRTAWIE